MPGNYYSQSRDTALCTVAALVLQTFGNRRSLVARWNGLLWASTFLKRSLHGSLRILFAATWDYVALIGAKSRLTHVLSSVIAGSDTCDLILRHANEQRYSVGFVGGQDHVREQMMHVISQRYPTLSCVASVGGQIMGEDDQEILSRLMISAPQILFLASSFPRQEQWMITYRDQLTQAGVRIVMGVGGTFDFLSGTKKRAPAVMRRLGLEWLFRLLIEPSRWKRILRAVIVFPWRITMDRIQGYAALFTLFPPLEHTKSKRSR